jgi:hypothetical protein
MAVIVLVTLSRTLFSSVPNGTKGINRESTAGQHAPAHHHRLRRQRAHHAALAANKDAVSEGGNLGGASTTAGGANGGAAGAAGVGAGGYPCCFVTMLVRSKDLTTWEFSAHNPLMGWPDWSDRVITPGSVLDTHGTAKQKQIGTNQTYSDINRSDQVGDPLCVRVCGGCVVASGERVGGFHLARVCGWVPFGTCVCVGSIWYVCVGGFHLARVCVWVPFGTCVWVGSIWHVCVGGFHLARVCVWVPFGTCVCGFHLLSVPFGERVGGWRLACCWQLCGLLVYGRNPSDARSDEVRWVVRAGANPNHASRTWWSCRPRLWPRFPASAPGRGRGPIRCMVLVTSCPWGLGQP